MTDTNLLFSPTGKSPRRGGWGPAPQSLLVSTLIAAGAAGAVAWRFTRDLGRARARLAGVSAVVETPLGEVEYAETGDGSPVLCVHGAGGGFDQGLDMTAALAGRGFRLIAPSRFGYLRSARPRRATPAMQADAFAALLDSLGVGRVSVVAISAGAWSALAFAARYPERCRALVLLVPAAPLPPGVKIRGGALAKAIFTSDFAAWAAVSLTPLAPGALGRLLLGVDPAVLRGADAAEAARLRRILEGLLPVKDRAPGMLLDIAAAADPDEGPIEAIACPVLAISSEDDPFGTAHRARSIATAVPNGEALIYKTGGHALVGRHDPALTAVAGFLRGAD